jgi:hypothetical protein
MDHVQLRLEYENMTVNKSNDVCYCYYFDVNHAFLSSSGKKEKNSEKKKGENFFSLGNYESIRTF